MWFKLNPLFFFFLLGQAQTEQYLSPIIVLNALIKSLCFHWWLPPSSLKPCRTLLQPFSHLHYSPRHMTLREFCLCRKSRNRAGRRFGRQKLVVRGNAWEERCKEVLYPHRKVRSMQAEEHWDQWFTPSLMYWFPVCLLDKWSSRVSRNFQRVTVEMRQQSGQGWESRGLTSSLFQISRPTFLFSLG